MVLKLSTSEPTEEAKQEDFFSIDDVMYTIPVDVPAVEGVRYLNDVKEQGVEVAVARLMHRMVGERGMKALGRATNMSPDDFRFLITTVQSKVNRMIEAGGLGN
jgi:hypothetical protein